MFIRYCLSIALLLPLSGCVTLESPTEAFDRISKKSDDKAAVAVLNDPSPHERSRAARELGRKGDAASVELLRKALRDSEALVRSSAADALKESGDTGKVAEGDVMETLQAEENPTAAVSMGWALQRWKSDLRPGLDSLRKVVNQQEDARARYHAALIVRSLVDVGVVAPVYVDTLGTEIARDSKNKPDELLTALIEKSPDAVLPFIVEGAKHERPETRAEVARLLYKFRPKVDPAEVVRQLMLNPKSDIQKTVLPPDVESALLSLMKDPDATVRAATAWSLGMCQPAPYASAPLLKAALGDSDERVRAAAVGSLAPLVAMGKAPEGGLASMGKLLSDTSAKVRSDAALAIAHSGKLPADITRTLSGLLDPAKESDATVRQHAAVALGSGADVRERNSALMMGLTDTDETVVQRCLASIGMLEIGDVNVLNAVAKKTTPDNSFGMRLSALGSLASIGAKAAPVRAAVVAAQADPNSAIQQSASFALERIDHSSGR